MRVAIVFALALLCLIVSHALSFPGQQFVDDEVPGLEFDPSDRCNCICPNNFIDLDPESEFAAQTKVFKRESWEHLIEHVFVS